MNKNNVIQFPVKVPAMWGRVSHNTGKFNIEIDTDEMLKSLQELEEMFSFSDYPTHPYTCMKCGGTHHGLEECPEENS